MSDRIVVRVFATMVLTSIAVVVGIYFLNPLRVESNDFLLRVIGVKAFWIPSHSMEPAIRQNEKFLVSVWAYSRAEPKPGDIVALQVPWHPGSIFAKRVIADGGSTVEIVNGVTIVNGKPISEPYIEPRNNMKEYSRRMYLISVPPKSFFVMGDNRDNSEDSRSWGYVHRWDIVGRVSAPNNRSRDP